MSRTWFEESFWFNEGSTEDANEDSWHVMHDLSVSGCRTSILQGKTFRHGTMVSQRIIKCQMSLPKKLFKLRWGCLRRCNLRHCDGLCSNGTFPSCSHVTRLRCTNMGNWAAYLKTCPTNYDTPTVRNEKFRGASWKSRKTKWTKIVNHQRRN